MDWFKVYTNWSSAVEVLTDEEAGRLLKGIYAYALKGEIRKGTGREELLMAMAVDAMKRDLEKYEQAVAEEEAKKERKRLSAQHAAEARWGRAQEEECPGHAGQERACGGHSGHAGASGGQNGHPRACKNKSIEKEIYKDPEEDTPSISPEPPAVEIPLNDGSMFPVRRANLEEYASLYPAVNVAQELRNMRGWCMGNPDRRKTRRGVKRFIHAWLSRVQDKGGKSREPPGNPFLSYALGEKEFGDLAL